MCREGNDFAPICPEFEGSVQNFTDYQQRALWQSAGNPCVTTLHGGNQRCSLHIYRGVHIVRVRAYGVGIILYVFQLPHALGSLHHSLVLDCIKRPGAATQEALAIGEGVVLVNCFSECATDQKGRANSDVTYDDWHCIMQSPFIRGAPLSLLVGKDER